MAFSSAPGQQLQWLYAPALNAAYTINSRMSIGVQRLTFGTIPLAAGERDHFGMTPYFEYWGFFNYKTQWFGQAGIAWQSRSGAGLDPATGIALSVAGGIRWWLTDHISLGLMGRALDVLSAGFAMSPRILPSGALITSLGFMLEAHF